jgi:hypothetical protein
MLSFGYATQIRGRLCVAMGTGRFPEILWNFRAETGTGAPSHSPALGGKAKFAVHAAEFD